MAWAALLLAGVSLGTGVAEASVDDAPAFDCAKARHAAEHRICADPVLRAADRALATAWARALQQTGDRAALQADQRGWLGRRNRCGDHWPCLRRAYAVRQVELAHAAGPFRWAGTWQRVSSPGVGAELVVVPPGSGSGTLTVNAANGGNTGMVDAALERTDARTLAARVNERCRLTLRRVHAQLDVAQAGDDAACGLGAGVFLDGRYVRSPSDPGPQWNLLSLGVVEQPQRDADIRRRLGEGAYADLIARANQVMPSDTHPGLTELGVRGLYTLMEAAVYQDGAHWWVAILDDEVRLWSSHAGWSGQPPGFDAWRARFPQVPVRVMPPPGPPPHPATGIDGR